MRFKGLDLNLLQTLAVLIERESVTRAAEQLHISQPALSAALARLRRHFDDPLLVPFGRQMRATPFALEIKGPLTNLLTEIDALVGRSAQFDPVAAQRTFRVMASDFILLAVLGPLLPRLEAEAPGIRIETVPPGDAGLAMIDSGEIDLFISPPQFLHPGHPVTPLFEDEHVVAGWRDNPLVQRPLDRATMAEAQFVSVQLGRSNGLSFAESELARAGLPLRRSLMVPYFGAVPHLLIGTGRLAVLQRRLVEQVARDLPLVWQPLPVAIPLMAESAQVHRTRASDAALNWLIDALRTTINPVGG